MQEQEVEKRYKRILTLFFAGRMPRLNHARHIAVGNILRHLQMKKKRRLLQRDS